MLNTKYKFNSFTTLKLSYIPSLSNFSKNISKHKWTSNRLNWTLEWIGGYEQFTTASSFSLNQRHLQFFPFVPFQLRPVSITQFNHLICGRPLWRVFWNGISFILLGFICYLDLRCAGSSTTSLTFEPRRLQASLSHSIIVISSILLPTFLCDSVDLSKIILVTFHVDAWYRSGNKSIINFIPLTYSCYSFFENTREFAIMYRFFDM